jgi:hypothetical protein
MTTKVECVGSTVVLESTMPETALSGWRGSAMVNCLTPEVAGMVAEELRACMKAFRVGVRLASAWPGDGTFVFDADGVPLWFLNRPSLPCGQPLPVVEEIEAWSRDLGSAWQEVRVPGSRFTVEVTTEPACCLAAGGTSIALFPSREAFDAWWWGFVTAKPAIGVVRSEEPGGGYGVEARFGGFSYVVEEFLEEDEGSLVEAVRVAKGLLRAMEEGVTG